jgi:hypothetical protein
VNASGSNVWLGNPNSPMEASQAWKVKRREGWLQNLVRAINNGVQCNHQVYVWWKGFHFGARKRNRRGSLKWSCCSSRQEVEWCRTKQSETSYQMEGAGIKGASQ